MESMGIYALECVAAFRPRYIDLSNAGIAHVANIKLRSNRWLLEANEKPKSKMNCDPVQSPRCIM